MDKWKDIAPALQGNQVKNDFLEEGEGLNEWCTSVREKECREGRESVEKIMAGVLARKKSWRRAGKEQCYLTTSCRLAA